MGSSGHKPEKRKITEPEMFSALKSICKISILNKISFGFLIKFFKQDKDFYCLMTNKHIITQDMIKKKEKITFYYDDDKTLKEIYLNPNERYIKDFTDMNLDAIVIEILPKDNIDKNYFLMPVIDYISEYNKLINKEIVLLQNLFYYSAKIKTINKYEFSFIDNIKSNTSGIPIFLYDNMKVIGICKNDNYEKNDENYADFIGPIFNFFKNFEQCKTVKIAETVEKTEHERHNLSVSSESTDLISEALFNENNLEMDENDNDENGNGSFVNGKLEGKGKYIWENGNYYIGPFKNGKKNGKGIIYYKNGNIMYEGDFVNDKREGNGKFIWKTGQYYIGQWKNNRKHGKGADYNKKGNLVYEGDYVNGKLDGNGKLMLKNGQYYIGQFKNGKRNGKGIIYYKNGNIKCTTNFE